MLYNVCSSLCFGNRGKREVGMAEKELAEVEGSPFSTESIINLNRALALIREHGGYGEIRLEICKGQVRRVAPTVSWQNNLVGSTTR
jgi:hypothetical protein